MRPTAIQFLASMLVAAALHGQSTAPTLVAVVEGKQPVTLQLQKMRIDARIVGYLAETRMTMTFVNAGDRVLEGDLYFPLPEGATVSGYALDINGVMVDGVVVEKEKGRVVFEQIVRRGIDPGLVEWTKGNVFKTRIFPIPAHGTRTAMVRYVSELGGDAGGGTYRLPFDFKQPVPEVSLRVVVEGAESKPIVTHGGPAGLVFNKWRDEFVAEATVRDARLDQELVLELPSSKKSRVYVERAPDGETFFYLASFRDARGVGGGGSARAPKRVTIVWDVSGSRGRSDHARELQFIREYFAQFADRTVAVELALFDITVRPARRFEVRNGDSSELRAALEGVNYDGGTKLGALATHTGDITPDLYLLFSDGLSTFGEEQPGPFAAPVYSFAAAPAMNAALLRRIAAVSGGGFVNLAADGVPAALAAIGRTSVVLREITGDLEAVEGLVPATPVETGARTCVAGRLVGSRAALTLHWAQAGHPVASERFVVDNANARDGSLVRTFWAQKQIEELIAFPKREAKKLAEIGRRYGLVTPGTSLIVLDRLDQYIQYEIAPPAGVPGWREQYERVIAARRKDAVDRQQQKLDNVLRQWQERVSWWQTDFAAKLEEEKRHVPKQITEGTSRPTAAADRRRADTRPEVAGEEQGRVFAERITVGGVAGGVPAARDAATSSLAMAVPAPVTKQGEAPRSGTIAIQPWNPDTPYLEALRKTPADQAEAVYFRMKERYGGSAGFYLDCADFFLTGKRRAVAVRILSNLAEMDLEDASLLRILGYRLAQIGEPAMSTWTFEQVLAMRPEEPQSYRDLALVLAKQRSYKRALDLLAHVVMNQWDRFDGIEAIALEELNAMLPQARAAGVRDVQLDPRLLKLLDVDVRVVLTWDADLTDVDLWVTEPSSEKAMYNHNRTRAGGFVSRDFTQGYGPEEYWIRTAQHGTYKIQADYYGTRSNKILGPVTLQVEVITNFGRANEQRRAITVRLASVKQAVDVGEVTF